MVATLPTYPAVEKVFETPLAPINASLGVLSQRVSAARPPQAQAPTRAPVPPTNTTTQRAPLPAQHVARVGAPPPPRVPLPLSTLTFPGTTRTPAPFTATLVPTRTSSWTSGRQSPSGKRSTPTPPPSSLAISPPTAPSPSPRMPRQPPRVPRRARRIRAASRPPKLRQPVTSPLLPRHRGHSLRPKEGSTLPVLLPLSTLKDP